MKSGRINLLAPYFHCDGLVYHDRDGVLEYSFSIFHRGGDEAHYYVPVRMKRQLIEL
ncbi:MAG: hypothetical protein JKY16_02870 [Lutibacter sp.]|nr:hypothetical protein [Lutibacter sp.]